MEASRMADNSRPYTLMVLTSDGYSDCWEPFFTLLERYWPDAKRYPVILNTESKTYQREGWDIQCFQFYKGRKAPSYATRLRRHLAEVKTPLVLCFQEDFFLREPVDQARLDDCAQAMLEDSQISCINFQYMGQNGFPCERLPGFLEFYPVPYYRLSFSSPLWRVKEMKRLWKPGASPWTWEMYTNRRMYCTRKKFYFAETGSKRVINYGQTLTLACNIVRGQWYREDVVPFFEKEGITVDYAVRGWFDPDAFAQSQRLALDQVSKAEKFKSLVMELYLGGFKIACMRLCYSIYKRLFRIPLNFDDYMRAKYNPPDYAFTAHKT